MAFSLGRPCRAIFPLLLVACGSSGHRPASAPEPRSPEAASGTPPSATATDLGSDAPEISRSLGPVAGAIVLWPRIVLPRGSGAPDEDTRRIAAAVQARAAAVARRVFANVDVRPEPERVCPKTGCSAVSVGVLLARAGSGCSVIALVSAPGPSPAELVPWSPGVVKLSASRVLFREHAEAVVKVQDYARCSDLPGALGAKDADVEGMLRSTPGH